MERLLHYVWKYRLYPGMTLTTTDGKPLTILDPGIHNTHAGPDFFNAKLKIEETVWVGDVEIHTRASDWHHHKHSLDKRYDSIILHVVGMDDRQITRMNGESIPQLVIEIPEEVRRSAEWLVSRETSVPCLNQLRSFESVHLYTWLDALLGERLQRKIGDIFQLLEEYQYDWNEVFYITLTRNFGLGVNSDAFEWLARSLPLKCIRKQRGASSQVEAMFFGQAGMLEGTYDCHYFKLLQQEYRFLRYKFDLKPLDSTLYKSLRIRPSNFPHVKIAQLSALWSRYDTLFSMILEAGNLRQIKRLFRVPPSDYWETHYHFQHVSAKKEKLPGDQTLNIVLINTVVPMLFAYGYQNNLTEYTDRAIEILERLPAEKNRIITLFDQAGIVARHAGDTQSIIQLKREYCEKGKCLFCRIGFQLLKRCCQNGENP